MKLIVPESHPSDYTKDISSKNLRGMNVVFINMPLRESAAPNVTPQGPLLLATNLRDNYGVNASIVDLNGHRIKDESALKRGLQNGRHLTPDEAYRLIQDHFNKYGTPDLVGFSGKITTLAWQKRVAKMIRTLLPDVFIVSGNGLATELKTGLFNYIPELDAVARSEGDDVIVKIVYDAKLIRDMGFTSAINSGKLAPYYLGELKGKHRFMYLGDRPKNINAIPFADLELLAQDVWLGRELLERYIKTPVWGRAANNSSATSFTMERSTTFVSSRGCPYACAFCYRGAQGERNYGMRSPENLAGEFILHQKKYNVDFIGLPDDNFAVDPKRIADLVPLIKPLGIRWGTHTRLDEAAGLRPKSGRPNEFIFEDPKRIDHMAEMGCIYIGFGAESASPAVLQAMDKGGFTLKNGLVTKRVDGRDWEFPRSYYDGIKNCEYAGIHANCTWIMGYPTETLEDLKVSVAFMKWQEDFYSSRGKQPDSVNRRMFTATWYPGTAMLNHPKVKKTLNDVFGITINPFTREPVCDDRFEEYVLALDDATKILNDPKTGTPLNFGEMPMEQFLKAREYIDAGETFKILEM